LLPLVSLNALGWAFVSIDLGAALDFL